MAKKFCNECENGRHYQHEKWIPAREVGSTVDEPCECPECVEDDNA